MNMYHILLIYSSIDSPLGCFHFLATKSNVAVNIHVQIFVCTCLHFSWAYMKEWSDQVT